MKVIINSRESIIQNEEGQVDVVELGYLDNVEDLAEEIVGRYRGRKWEIILNGMYAVDDIGKLKYRNVTNSLLFFLGRTSTIHARKIIRDSRLSEDVRFDTIVYKKGRDTVQDYVFYSEDLLRSIEQEIIKDKDSSIDKIMNVEHCIIKDKYNERKNKVIVYNIGEKIVCLYIKGKQLLGKMEYDSEYYSVESVEEEIITTVRSEEYNEWLESEVDVLDREEMIRSIFSGSEVRGGGYGEIHSFFKYNFKMEEI